MDIIRWEEPPPMKRKALGPAGRYVAIANALRERPGEWAIVRENVPGNFAWQINHGKVKGFTLGLFEATSRSNGKGDKTVTVYARFIG